VYIYILDSYCFRWRMRTKVLRRPTSATCDVNYTQLTTAAGTAETFTASRRRASIQPAEDDVERPDVVKDEVLTDDYEYVYPLYAWWHARKTARSAVICQRRLRVMKCADVECAHTLLPQADKTSPGPLTTPTSCSAFI